MHFGAKYDLGISFQGMYTIPRWMIETGECRNVEHNSTGLKEREPSVTLMVTRPVKRQNSWGKGVENEGQTGQDGAIDTN